MKLTPQQKKLVTLLESGPMSDHDLACMVDKPGVRYCGYKLCEEETADPEKAAEFREKLLDAFDNCSKCKLPYAKVGQYQATPYCMACWLVVSQAPVL